MRFEYKYTEKQLIDELQRVAKFLKRNMVSIHDMTKYGKFSPSVYQWRWGNWSKAVTAAGLIPIPLGCKGIPRPKSPFPRDTVYSYLKLAILKRDCYKCVLCGASPANDERVILHIDHIKPVVRGGKSTVWNLWVLCSKCNYTKSTSYDSELARIAANYLARRFFEKCL